MINIILSCAIALASTHNYVAVINYNQPSYEKRLYLFNNVNKTLLSKHYVAHGVNSGLVYATKFSNKVGSRKSSLGVYRTGKVYYGKHGKSLRLHGLSKTNSNAYKRAVVIHTAKYVSDQVVRRQGRLGRSWGCPAIDKKDMHLIDKLKNGAIVIIIGNQ
jgi:hypothetical protein